MGLIVQRQEFDLFKSTHDVCIKQLAAELSWKKKEEEKKKKKHGALNEKPCYNNV